MKHLNLGLMLYITISMNISCSVQPQENGDKTGLSEKNGIEVYYFHSTRRCATCKAIEEVSKSTVESVYGDAVSFTGYNLDEAEGKQKAQDLGISGQTLLIVIGDKKMDMTNEAFMYARSNPDKLKETLMAKIDPLL